VSDQRRVFFALPIEAAELGPLLDAQARMRRVASRLSPRFVAAAQLHVTLKFLGFVHTDHLADLRAATRAQACAAAPMDSELAGLTGFGSPARARVLVAELSDPEGRMAALSAALEDVATTLNVPRETRAFRPHVTLARIKRPGDARAILEAGALERAAIHFRELVLYESKGGVYTALERCALGPESS
jgi:2'-5' RNA ligase